MTKQKQALITLPDGGVTILTGDIDIYTEEDGSLRVLDYTPPRDGSGLVFAAVAGQWLRVVVSDFNNLPAENKS